MDSNLGIPTWEQRRTRHQVKRDVQARHLKQDQYWTQIYLAKKQQKQTKRLSLINNPNVLLHTFTEVVPVSKEMAGLKKQAEQVAAAYKNNNNKNLVLYSKQSGNGKTLLASCILAEVGKSPASAKTCMFVSTTQIKNLVNKKFDNTARQDDLYGVGDELDEFERNAGRVDLLVLDDLGTESSLKNVGVSSANQTISEKLFNIAEKREFKPTIITTNYTGDELKKIYNNKIIDRLMPTNPAQVLNFEHVPSYRKN